MNKTLTILTIIVIALTNQSIAQTLDKADSLKRIVSDPEELSDSLIAKTIFEIIVVSSSPDEILEYTDLLLEKSQKEELLYYYIQAHIHKGIAYRLKGDIENSLENLFLAAGLSAAPPLEKYLAEAYMEIGASYSANDDLSTSVSFESKGIEIMRRTADIEQLSISLLNIGFSYYTLNKYDSALICYQEASPLFDSISFEIGKAYLIGNRALVYWKKGDRKNAETGLLKAIEMLKKLSDRYGEADFHNQLASIYFEDDRSKQAVIHAEQALELARSLGLKEQIRDAVLLLSKLFKKQGKFSEAFRFQNLYIVYKDSIENSEQIRKIANLRTKYEVNLKETEIDLLEKKQRLNNIYILVAIILLLLAVVAILYFAQRVKTAKLVTINERKSHNGKITSLLKNQENKALESMVQGRDNERRRLAQELHNHFGSLLATIKVNINSIEEESISNHSTLSTLIDQACNDMRSISHSLNMGISENFGLVPALRELVNHVEDADNLQVEFEASMCDGLMDSENEIIIYRIIQELVSNVLKHAEATKLSILLTCYEDEGIINILVNDNGKGFDISIISHKNEGIGLNSLRDMVENYSGDINFDSNEQSGTTVTIDLPIINVLKPI